MLSYSLDGCKKEGLKFKTRTEFKVQSGSIYSYAYKMGWLEECCTHMAEKRKPNGYWTKETCHEVAKKYTTRTEFSIDAGGAYTIAKRNDWLDEICSHMTVVGDKKHRAIYVFEFQDRHAYVGLSYNIKERKQQHLNNQKSPVYRHREKTLEYTFKNLTDYISINDATKMEKHFLNEYKNNGWTLLNTAKTGALGGSTLKWTFDRCLEEALEYNTRKEFETNSQSAYNSARRNKWLNEICSHMDRVQKTKNYWTEENCRDEALKYNYRTEFHKNAGSAYAAASKMGKLDCICSHMYKPIRWSKWTKERCQTKALNYQTKKEFKEKSPGAYSYASKKKFLEQICSHMKSQRKPNGYWTKEKCQKEAKKYNSKSKFQKGNVSAYRNALNNNWLEDICPHMITKTKPKNYWTKEQCKIEASKYKSRADFQKSSNVAYTKSCKNKWIDEICSHMVEIKKPNNYWTKERCKAEAIKYQSKKEFREQAGNVYAIAHKRGWIDEICSHMRPKRRPFGYWTKDKIIEEAAKYSTRSEFNKKSGGASTVARGYGWYEEIWKLTHSENKD